MQWRGCVLVLNARQPNLFWCLPHLGPCQNDRGWVLCLRLQGCQPAMHRSSGSSQQGSELIRAKSSAIMFVCRSGSSDQAGDCQTLNSAALLVSCVRLVHAATLWHWQSHTEQWLLTQHSAKTWQRFALLAVRPICWIIRATRLPMGAKCGKAPHCGLWVQRSNLGCDFFKQSSGIGNLGGTPEARLPPSWWGKCVINA